MQETHSFEYGWVRKPSDHQIENGLNRNGRELLYLQQGRKQNGMFLSSSTLYQAPTEQVSFHPTFYEITLQSHWRLQLLNYTVENYFLKNHQRRAVLRYQSYNKKYCQSYLPKTWAASFFYQTNLDLQLMDLLHLGRKLEQQKAIKK